MNNIELLEIAGETFDVLGKLFVAYAALRVHHRFRHEHKVDDLIFEAMRREQFWGLLGIALLILGYVIKILARFVL